MWWILALVLAVAAQQAEPPPRLELRSLQGEARSLADYRGKIVVLNFWATWCGPCREEMPLLEKLYREYKDRGVVVIGASLDAKATEARIAPFLEQHGLTFPVWKGAELAHVQEFTGANGVPATAIVDREGRIAARLTGPVSEAGLRARLERLLEGKAASAPR
jgi:thiol-disulfide isomerase/thioredoxin